MVVCTKICQLWPNRQVLIVIHKILYFLELFADNMLKTLKHGSLHEKLLVLANSISLDGFFTALVLFATFCGKLDKNP